ncbi:MAG: hypothetical protein IK093_00090 [Ruminiclostridium sp.]|nr:hypothetical protein [Ruminiclostridium sp.]
MGEKLKRGSLGGLIYRELYLNKKEFRAGAILFSAFTVFCLLVLLSFEHGNIGKILDLVIGDPSTEEARELAEANIAHIHQSIVFMMKMFPIFMSSQFIISGANITGRDELASWKRFARCTPVTPAKRAFVRMLMSACYITFSVLLAVVYMNIVGAMQNEPVTYSEYALSIMVIAAVTAFTVLAQIFTMIFHSMEKGILALVGIIMVPVWTAAFINGMGRHGKPDDDMLEIVTAFSEAIFPFTPLIIIGILGVGFAAMYALYKRREK